MYRLQVKKSPAPNLILGKFFRFFKNILNLTITKTVISGVTTDVSFSLKALSTWVTVLSAGLNLEGVIWTDDTSGSFFSASETSGTDFYKWNGHRHRNRITLTLELMPLELIYLKSA